MPQVSHQESILDFILNHCQYSPDTPAIVTNDKIITYNDLKNELYAVSSYIQNKGIAPGSIIAIMQSQLDSALASLLGCLHAGCIYCPIDPLMDSSKIQRTLIIANVELIICEQSLPYMRQSDDPEFVYYDEIPTRIPQDTIRQRYHPLAYIMFTSGSTGDPKGVAIAHANLIEVFNGWNDVYELNKIKKHLQLASLSFDVFAGDWLRGLCSGATIYAPAPAEKQVAETLINFITTHQIECAEFTPLILRKLYNYALNNKIMLSSFRLLIAGSDVMHAIEFKEIRKIIADDCRLVFSYGTTETTIDSTYFEPTSEVLDNLRDDSPLPIGVPFPCTLTAILRSDGTQADLHEIGELYIGGGGVGPGYLHQDARTSGRYLRRLPMGRHGRWYRTGDLASYDGKNFSLRGRVDAQIKVRGKLIDLTELEAHLRTHEDILECVATTTPHTPNKKILLLIKLKTYKTELKREIISQYIAHLEDHPVSSNNIYFIQDLPTTTSGKIDRKKASEIATKLQLGALT